MKNRESSLFNHKLQTTSSEEESFVNLPGGGRQEEEQKNYFDQESIIENEFFQAITFRSS